MENIKTNQALMGKMSIDRLMDTLMLIQKKKLRLTAIEVAETFNIIFHEIPYASRVIPSRLGEILLMDTPKQQNDIFLNEIVLNLGLALFDPEQQDALAELVQTYVNSRALLEHEYASTILESIFSEQALQVFPSQAIKELHQIALAIVEKVVEEKQLRKMPGHKAHAITDITHPIIYQNLHNVTLERIKLSHNIAFRKYISHIAHEAYEKIHDQHMLQAILLEKQSAINLFAKMLARKVPLPENIGRLQRLLSFDESDRLQKFEMLNKSLDEFLVPTDSDRGMGYLAHHLRYRFTEKLSKLINAIEVQPDAYRTELSIKVTHDEKYHIVDHEVTAIKYLVREALTIQANFKKNLLHLFAGGKTFELIEDALTDALLGKEYNKTDSITKKPYIIRLGGYPKESIATIYANTLEYLHNVEPTISGMFADKLKIEFHRAMMNISEYANKIHSSTDVAEQNNFADEIREAEDILADNKSVEEPVAEVTPEPLVIETETPLEELVIEMPKEEPKIETPHEELDLKTQKEPLFDFPKENLVLETPAEEPIIETQIEEPAIESITLEPITPEASSAPLQSDDPGLAIMSHYQLGEFKEAVHVAWMKMHNESKVDAEGHVLDFMMDHEVQLYVICDLLQQVAFIDANTLQDSQKLELQKLKILLLTVLENPLDEQNWSHFEGIERDKIDKIIASFQ